MKISKDRLREIIKEEMVSNVEQPEAAPQEPAELGTREKNVNRGVSSGAMMGAEQYAGILKQVLLSTKVAPQARKEALEAIFPGKGSAINTLVLQMLKGAQE